MRKVVALVVLGAAVTACDAPKETSTVSSVFEKNCETIRTVVDNLQNDVADFQYYSEDFVGAQTRFNTTGDSTRLDEFKTNRLKWLEIFDAELTTPLNLLPGVNPQTNEVDGSVRYYGVWKVTKSATDSTEAKSVMVPIYASYDFDEDGKILYQQVYGDRTAALQSLN